MLKFLYNSSGVIKAKIYVLFLARVCLVAHDQSTTQHTVLMYRHNHVSFKLKHLCHQACHARVAHSDVSVLLSTASGVALERLG